MKKILFVDDETQILKSLMRLFIDSEYEVITADSGLLALKILEENEVNMIISDMRMPNMDGYELLLKVKEKYPKTMRIILSGYSDEKVVFKALQKNIAKLYMFKPWENDKLVNLVDQMFETEDLLTNNNLLTLINNIESLPTIKANYQKILNLIDQDSDVSFITSAIERDVSISAKILQVANSAFYGGKTGSIKQAVTYIGLENTRKLVMSTSLIDSMSEDGKTGEIIDEIWKHSFFANRILAFIYDTQLKKRIPDSFSTAALLQNIGSIFFLKYFKKDYLKLRQIGTQSNTELVILEKNYFNVTHSEMGAYLLKWWEFPYPIIETALFHHDPLNKNIINKELLICSHIANKYALDLSNDKPIFSFDENIFKELNIEKSNFEEAIKKFDL